MHPKEYFDRNPFRDEGKGGKHRGEAKERSKSAPSDKKPFKYSSPGKVVRSNFSVNDQNFFYFFFRFSLVEIKMDVLINFQNVVKKILMLLVQCLLKLKMKLINKVKHFFQINFLKAVQRILSYTKMLIYK
jgi:hypothetical protein